MKPFNPIRKKHLRFNKLKYGLAIALCLSCPVTVLADASSAKNIAPLKPDMPYIFVVHNGRSVRIERDIDDSYRARISIRGKLIQTADTCPPFCLQPQKLDLPVETVGELEIVDFMMNQLRSRQGALIDVRNKIEHDASTIPGSENYFIQLIQKGPGDAEFDEMLIALGAERRGEISAWEKTLAMVGLKDISMMTDSWDFTEAKELVLWSNSAIERLPVLALKELLAAGYPAAKLKWYRGGLASWQYWGFTTYNKNR